MSGTDKFLTDPRDELKARRFAPLAVREKLIPKKGRQAQGIRYSPIGRK
jgi:hypothetical protein